ncbi:HTH-type transcriptional activator CmpR [Tsuneonella dongtanensis]|uniref:HTH-type transcriptional activator CmpR n=1 Tax=Tsuneonella dongtanensis TaxID=692370 RepID=A0A1B2ABQ6_9SPHN|nr:LysR family transcriptional regulator [Tsuneonella dongtanensis]ANY19602.1 HTH-type transcriptional activator CmpR [Tsuneonella dongtanensis]
MVVKMPIPSIRQLSTFTAVFEHGSITRAAEAVHLTQSALTQALARLERDLGCRLFDRQPEGMRPTEPARFLAPRVNDAIEKIGSRRVTAAQMRAFLAVASAGSYSGAAEATGLAPASLHRAVADLSLALGERLVERRGRYLSLTRKGASRARKFRLALAELRSGYAEVADWLGKAKGRIVIGAMPLSRARWLPAAIVRHVEEFPFAEVSVIEGSHDELVGPLRDGDIDVMLGALRTVGAHDDLTHEDAFEDHPKIVMRNAHPLANTSKISTASMRQYPWVLPSASTPLRQFWNELVGSDDAELPHVSIECGSVLTIREILLRTDSLTLLSPDQVRVEIDAGQLRAAAPPIRVSRTIGITTRRGWLPTRQQQAFVETLRRLAIEHS